MCGSNTYRLLLLGLVSLPLPQLHTHTQHVSDYDAIPAIADDELGSAAILLSDLVHQRRVDQWFPLIGADGEEKGEVRLILEYRFNRAGEALSRFWAEPPYKPDWPKFAPNITFGHVKDLMKETEPYVALLQGLAAVLQWARPLVTLVWLAVILALTVYPRFIYSALQLLLALQLLRNWIWRRGLLQLQDISQATAGRCVRVCLFVL